MKGNVAFKSVQLQIIVIWGRNGRPPPELHAGISLTLFTPTKLRNDLFSELRGFLSALKAGNLNNFQ
jgi:hypothetical protein